MNKVVTLDKVRKTYLALEQQGESTSVRNIVALTGGSNKTVLPLIRQFEEQRRAENELNYSMSENFRQAYIDDMIVVTKKAKSELKTALSSALEQEQYLLNELIQAEQQIKTLQTQLNEAKDYTGAESRANENRLSAIQQQVVDLQQERESLKQEEVGLQKQINKLNSELSASKLLLSQAEVNAQSLKEENSTLRESTAEQQRLMSGLEKQTEIAKDRSQTTLQQLGDIKAELLEVREKLDTERERRIEAEKQLSVLQAKVEINDAGS